MAQKKHKAALKMFVFVAVSSAFFRVFSQDNNCGTLENCQAALKANRQISLAHYRLAEIFFQSQKPNECQIDHSWPNARVTGCRELMKAANEFREALAGDLEPKWIEVWAHIYLGKIFDMEGQRERALNEYRVARRTNDNTRGAQEDAARYTQTPFKLPSN